MIRVSLAALCILVLAASANASLVALWTFGPSAANYTLNPDVDAIGGSVLTAGGATYDIDGGNGVVFTDAGGTLRAAGQSAHWSDASGSGGNDALITIALNTTNWQDMVVRFDYNSDNTGNKKGPQRFDFDYKIDSGDWVSVVNNQPITRDDAWHVASLDLSGIAAINGQPSITFRINDLKDDTDGDFWLDNVQVTANPIPEPATLSLLLIGLFAAGRRGKIRSR